MDSATMLTRTSLESQVSEPDSTAPAITGVPGNSPKKPVDIRIQLQAKSNVQIIQPLHDKILHLLSLHCDTIKKNDSLPCAAVSELNAILAESTVIWQLGSSAVLGLSHDVAVKIGYSIDYGYISTMNYIKENASGVPTPDMYGVLAAKNRTYLFMSRIHGVSLDKLWAGMSHTQKASIQYQLESVFQSLRAIPGPTLEDGCPTLGGGCPRRCKDMRRHERVATVPIVNEEQFNDFLIETDGRKTVGLRAKMIRSFLRSDHRIVMTHGDLHPRNIIVTVGQREEVQEDEGDVKVVGLIDWETCGWYPEYWEFVKALSTLSSRDGLDDWWDYLPTAIGRWPGEYAIDEMLSRYVD
ncbi:hypothetical protein K440DRAFT_643505 [Wilcoxina mikolae CBS 423.85]|nr:hypothetical protein K440DRAFT_643505 [Wilcoxina mikolae CBS 423.85]